MRDPADADRSELEAPIGVDRSRESSCCVIVRQFLEQVRTARLVFIDTVRLERILQVVDELKPSCKHVLYHLVRQQYKGLFAPENQALPNRILAPSLFSLLSSRNEKYMKIKRQYGLTTQTLEGVVPHARDAKVLVALSQIRKRKKLDHSYMLTTTYGEMLKVLGHRCHNETKNAPSA